MIHTRSWGDQAQSNRDCELGLIAAVRSPSLNHDGSSPFAWVTRLMEIGRSGKLHASPQGEEDRVSSCPFDRDRATLTVMKSSAPCDAT